MTRGLVVIGANGVAQVADDALTDHGPSVSLTAQLAAIAAQATADAAQVTADGATADAAAAQVAADAAQATADGKQPIAPNLTAFAALTGLADRVPYFTAAATMALAVFTAFGRSLVAAVDAAAAKALLALVKADVGLGNCDNTSDANKPVSTAQAAADALRVLKAGDTMTGFLTIQLAESAEFINSTNPAVGAYLLLQSNGTNIGSFQAGGTTMAAPYTDRMRIRAYRAAGGIDFAAGGSATAQVSVEPSGLLKPISGLQVGSAGTALTQVRVYTPTLTPAAVGLGLLSVQTFTVTGLATTDTISVSGPGAVAGVVLANWRVSAADTLELSWYGILAGTPPAGVWRIAAIRS